MYIQRPCSPTILKHERIWYLILFKETASKMKTLFKETNIHTKINNQNSTR